MATHSSILAWRIPWTRVTWWVTVHGAAKSWTRLSDLARTHTWKNTNELSDQPNSITPFKIPVILNMKTLMSLLTMGQELGPPLAPDRPTGHTICSFHASSAGEDAVQKQISYSTGWSVNSNPWQRKMSKGITI